MQIPPDPRDRYAPNGLPEANGEFFVQMAPVLTLDAVPVRRVVSVADDVVKARISGVQLTDKVLSPL